MRGTRAITIWKYIFCFEFCRALVAIREGENLSLTCSHGYFSELAWFKSASDTPEILARAGGLGHGAGATKGLSPDRLSYKQISLHGSFASRSVTNKNDKGDDGLDLVVPSEITDSGAYYCISCFQSKTVAILNTTEITVYNSNGDLSEQPGPKPSSSNVQAQDTIEWCGLSLLELTKQVPSLRRNDPHTSLAKRVPSADAPDNIPRTKDAERAPGVGVKEQGHKRQTGTFLPTDYDVFVEQRDHIGTYVSFSLFLCCVLVCAVCITKRNV